MKMRLASFLAILFLTYGMVSGDEVPAEGEMAPGEANSNNGAPKPEDFEHSYIESEGNATNTTGSQTKRGIAGDPRCRWSQHSLHNPGSILRCGCLRCVCSNTRWLCDYHFKFCPYFYCGNQVFNPMTQLCCCGKTYTKKTNWSCCGYAYYNRGLQKCCSYSTIKNKSQACPRYQI